jgi:hypothetical protein
MAEGFSIAEGFVEISSRIDRAKNKRNAEKAGNDAGDSFVTKMGTKLVSGLTSSVLPALGMLGAGFNAALAATPLLAQAGTAIWNVATAAGAAAPAVLALAVAGGLVGITLKAILPTVGKVLTPIKTAFDEAAVSASRFATEGLAPLADEFVKLNMPGVATMMDNIGKATNRVVGDTLRWLNTIPGMQAITNITSATGAAMLRLAPHLSAVVQSFIAMIGRIAGVSLAAGEGGLSGVLDRLVRLMDRVTADTVQGGLDDLKSSFLAVKGAVETVAHWIGVAIDFYRQYKTEINLISDALAILSIVFGGPVVAIIAAIGLVVRHFDQLKGAYIALTTSFSSSTEGPAFLNNLKAAADIVIPALVGAFHTLWAAIGPTLSKIWKQITTQLIPAFGEFVAAAAPVVAFFVEKMAPLIANAMKTILGVISGTITIITGIFKVFTGILRGDWSMVWAGIKQILRGAVAVILSILRGLLTGVRIGLSNLGSILAGIFRGAVNMAISAFRAIVGRAKGVVSDARSAIRGGFADAGSWLVSAGGRIISGLITGIRNKLGELRNMLNSVTNVIPKWKGPPKKDAKLLTPAGRKIMGGLISGVAGELPALKQMLGLVTRTVAKLALSRAGSSPAASPSASGKIPATSAVKSKAAELLKTATGTSAAGGTSGDAGGSTSGGGGLSINSLTIQLQGILDPTDPASTRRMIAALFELLKAYEKSYA